MKAASSEEVSKDRSIITEAMPVPFQLASAVGPREPEKPLAVGQRQPWRRAFLNE